MAPLLRHLGLCALMAALSACAGSGSTVVPHITASGQSTTELPTASDTTSEQRRASIRLQLAVSYYQDHKYDVALDEIKQALVIEPQLAEAYGLRGLVYDAMGEQVLAEANFKRALSIAPSSPELANNYGSYLCQNNRAAESIAWFDKALANRTYTSPVSALVNAGRCSLKIKHNDAAEHYLLDALRLAPDLPQVNADLARIYYDRHDMTRAGFFINRLTTVSKLDSLSPEVLWLAIRIEHKLGDRTTESTLVSTLSKHYPGSRELADFQHGAFDE
jgi:type IV pilus assembly protein PilF